MKKSLSIGKLVLVSLVGVLMTALFALPVVAGEPTSTTTSADQELMVSVPAEAADNSVSPATTVETSAVPSVAEEGSDVLPNTICPCLFDKAAEEGQVPVIAGLRSPTGTFTPEGDLASAAAVDAQREAIATAREALVGSLAGYNAEVYASWNSLPYVAMKVDATALEQLADSPYVTSIQEDSLSEPQLASATAHIGADDTWDAGFGGMGRTVVILDTGIDADHPFFGGRVVDEACFSNGPGGGTTLCPNGANSQTGPGSADALTAQCMDGANCLCAHGSHVAGIAAGRDPGGAGATGYNGIAPEANIIAIQVFTRFNNAADCPGGVAPCVLTYDTDQMDALDYVNNVLRLSWDIDSINMSLGGDMYTAPCDGDSRKLSIDNLLSNGIATVISSGNNGWTDRLGAPGCISTAVTVGAVYDGNPCATFDEVTYNMHSVVDLLAVGRCVDSSVPDDAWGLGWGGTSMAAPQVTGAFAMIRSIDPGMSVADILDLLKTTGVLVRDNRAPNPAGDVAGHVKPRIQLDAAVASLTEANLRVFKDCKPDRPMLAGETATCTITVENLGPDPALSVMAVDEYLSSGTFEFGTVTSTAGTCTATWNPQIGAGTVTCELGAIGPGDSVTIKVPVTADEPQDINDRVTVSSITPDPDPDNNVWEDSITVVAAADLEITKTDVPDPVVAGTSLTYTLTVTNNGPSTATNVVVKDWLPADVVIDSLSATAGAVIAGEPGDADQPTVWNVDSISMGQSEDMTVVVTVKPQTAEGTLLYNDAEVSSADLDLDNSNNVVSADTTVTTEADLSIDKMDFPDPVIAGEQLTYEVTITNNGPSTARDVSLTEELPPEVTFIDASISNGGTCEVLEVPPLTVECQLDDIDPGESVLVFVTVLVDPSVSDGSLISNTATVSSSTADPDNTNNVVTEDTTVNAEADLMIEKDVNFETGSASTTIIYFIKATNLGPSDAQNVVVVDYLPSVTTKGGKQMVKFVFATEGCQYDAMTHTVQYDHGILAAGGSFNLEIHIQVNGSPGVITNTVEVTSDTSDPDSGNNTAIKDVTVKGGTYRPGGPGGGRGKGPKSK